MRFFFTVYDDEVTPDEEGQELPDEAAARAKAIVEARVLAAEQVDRGHLIPSHRIDVTDEAGKLVESITLAQAVRVDA